MLENFWIAAALLFSAACFPVTHLSLCNYCVSRIWFRSIETVWGQKNWKNKINENFIAYIYLTNITHNFHLLSCFKFFGLKLNPIPPNHILLTANICNFLNSNCSDEFNSKKYYNSQFGAHIFLMLSLFTIFYTKIVLMPRIQKISKQIVPMPSFKKI